MLFSKVGTFGQPLPDAPCLVFDAILEGSYLRLYQKGLFFLPGRLEGLLPTNMLLRAKGGRPQEKRTLGDAVIWERG